MFEQQRTDWITPIGRIGYFAKGIVYFCVGVFSALAGMAGRARASDSRAAIETISEQPYGRVLLLTLAAGLLCFVVWRLIEAALDPCEEGRGFESVVRRGRSLFSGIIYSGITLAAVKTAMGSSSGSGGGDRTARDSAAKAIATPYGTWALIAIGIGLVIYGVFQWSRVYRGTFQRRLSLSSLGPDYRQWLVRICGFGLSARGLIFAIVGVFLVQAGLRSDPGEARGLSGALNSLRGTEYGPILFAVVAFGLAAYGVYCCVKGVYGRLGT
jgi:hypothetical protein